MPDTAPILLVEDSSGDILLMRRAFLKCNIVNPLTVVRTGEEAIDYLSGQGKFNNRDEWPLPGVILLDLKLPGKDGFEVLEWLRSQPGLRKLRVIVLTSSDSIYDVDRAYKLGANSFLVKPVAFERLVEIMQAVRGYWIFCDTPPTARRPPASTPEAKKDEAGPTADAFSI